MLSGKWMQLSRQGREQQGRYCVRKPEWNPATTILQTSAYKIRITGNINRC